MNTLIVVQHCEAEGQKRDAPLSPRGIEQAAQLTQFFLNRNDSVSKIICSPYKRAIQTIEPLAQHLNQPILQDSRLAERILSPYPLENWEELLKKSFEDLDFCLQGGESNRQAFYRVAPLIRQELEGEESVVVFVTHSNLMTCILKYFAPQIGFEKWQELSNPDVYEIKFSPTGTKITRVWTEPTNQSLENPKSTSSS